MMNLTLVKQIRIEQTRRELERLRTAITAWLAKRRKADENLKQYNTQLNVLESLFDRALLELRCKLNDVMTSGLYDVYHDCRLFDRRVLWVRRIWDYFRLKFDQRDGEFKHVLAAADEVVWSCYSATFKRVPGANLGPVPLPYIEPRYSPQAVVRVEPPPDLKEEIDAQFIQSYLKELPIPVVRLGPNCIQSPWWLVYLGHEVGHQVQYDLLPKLQLVEAFGELLKAAVKSRNGSSGDDGRAQRWKQWGEEIFADAFSIFNLGGAAVWAMRELEMSDEKTMLTSNVRYPSPVVRLTLMNRIATLLGIDDQPAPSLDFSELLSGSPIIEKGRDLRQAAVAELEFVPLVAEAIVRESVGEAGRLADFCDWNADWFGPVGEVEQWSQKFLGQKPLKAEERVRAARLAVSGAIVAWSRVASVEDDARRQEEQRKLERMEVWKTIAASREDITRSSAAPVVKSLDFGERLASLLINASDEQLGL
jgi:hypothetical protein